MAADIGEKPVALAGSLPFAQPAAGVERRREGATKTGRTIPSGRLPSLDAYRGFTMLAMVSSGLGMAAFVGDPTWGWLAHQLGHLPWEGCTFWDLIQPSFMFIVGVAMPFAFARRREHGDSWGRQFAHVLQRALALILIGIFLDSYSAQVLSIGFIRVLQQIAIGYVLAFLVLNRGPLIQLLTAVLFLAAHTAAFLVYGYVTGTEPWTKGHNVGTWLDHLAGLPFNTDGYVTFNALSSAGTILFGVACGELLRSSRSSCHKLTVLVAVGLGALVLGLLLSGGGSYFPALEFPQRIPMVKKIWTASFAIHAAGWTCLMMAAFYLVIDMFGYQRWSLPLVVVGMNSIAVYVIANMFKPEIRRALHLFYVADIDFLPRLAPVWLAVQIVLVVWLIAYWLYRQRIFFKL
jgi:predicted acyltransferase